MEVKRRQNQVCAVLAGLFLSAVGFTQTSPAQFVVVAPANANNFYPAGSGNGIALRSFSLQTTESSLKAESPGLKVSRKYSRLNSLVVEATVEQLERAQHLGIISSFEPNVFYKNFDFSGVPTPSDQSLSPWLGEILGLDEIDASEDLTASGNDVIVAVIDTGAAHTHEYLSTALAINSAELSGTANVDDDNNGYIDDVYGGNSITKNGNISEVGTDHGTHVSGLVKAVRDQASVNFSQARNVKILPIRFIDSSGAGSTVGALDAIDYAIRRGSKVINASWGAGGEGAFSQALYNAMVQAYETYDIISLVAAGNAEGAQANNNDTYPYFPASFRIPGQITVSSVTPQFSFSGIGANTILSRIVFSDFSNYGANSVQIAAPGSYRNAYFEEYGVYSANAAFSGNTNLFVRKKGTSMAAPVVAGIAGVIRAINPSLTAYETRKVILETATASDITNNRVSSGAIANAAAAFARAQTEITTGENPAASGAAYEIYSETDTSSSGGERAPASQPSGGCGFASSLETHDSNGDGPFGGNSILLFSTLYAVFALLHSGKFRRLCRRLVKLR